VKNENTEMDIPSQTIVDVLRFLLPGFIAAGLLYSLTPSPRPIPFERVVQALIFTVVVQAGLVGVETSLIEMGKHVRPIGVWTDNVKVCWSIVLAVLLAIVLAWVENTDSLHALLRRIGITHQTSFASEWYGALSQARGYVVLHLTGQRRLYGWAEEWPNTSDRGHFVMAEAEWLVDGERIPLQGVERILVRAQDVEMVELMRVVEAVISTASENIDTNGRS
jgi:hypothetical protein